MSNALRNLKTTTLSALVLGLGLLGTANAQPMQDHGDHGDHAKDSKGKQAEFAGDPYMLATDGVTGKALGPVANQVIMNHEGRELRFANKANAETFKKSPATYLPAIDKKMVAQQLPYYPMKTCVVSGEELGGEMGDVIDVIYKNRLVRICCAGCTKSLKKNPTAVIGKINAAAIAAQSKAYPAKTCVVSGEELGGEMGDVIDVVVGNRLIKICCDGCRKKIAKDPLGVLAKLDAGKKGMDMKMKGMKMKGKAKKGHGDHDH